MHAGLILFSLFATQAGALHHETVNGRIADDSGRTVSGATVIVTRLSDHQSKVTDSDSNGRYTVDWPDGTGDYAVNVSARGYASINRHIVRSGADSIIVADFTLALAGAAHALTAVVVSAQRAQRDRDARGADPGASEFTAVTQNADRRLDPDLAGDLASIAA